MDLHQKLDHPHIIKFYDYLQTKKYYLFFLEYAENGDLFDYMVSNITTKKFLLKIYYQILTAIQFLHSKNIMHRDLKPENILLHGNLDAKLCDFGWSAECKLNERRESLCGTYEYMALEVYQGKAQTKKADIWSLGVLLFLFFQGYLPFNEQKIGEILEGSLSIEKSLIFASDCKIEVKNLIKKILKKNPENRPCIEGILNDNLFDQFRNEERSPDYKKQRRCSPISNYSQKYSDFQNKYQKQTKPEKLPKGFEKRSTKDSMNNSRKTSPLLYRKKPRVVKLVRNSKIRYNSERKIIRSISPYQKPKKSKFKDISTGKVEFQKYQSQFMNIYKNVNSRTKPENSYSKQNKFYQKIKQKRTFDETKTSPSDEYFKKSDLSKEFSFKKVFGHPDPSNSNCYHFKWKKNHQIKRSKL